MPEDAVGAIAQKRLTALQAKLGGLNGRPLQDKVAAVLDRYGVTRADLPLTIAQLVGIRNKLVHRGMHRREIVGVPLVLAVAALRELVRRLFLGILEYEGPYQAYVSGPASAYFLPRQF